MPGKVPPDDLLSEVFTRTGATDESVLQGPADGEDAAALAVGDETLVVSSDPISLAAEHAGTLGVYVACNDVAVSGVDPRWLTVVLILPDGDSLDPLIRDLDVAAREVGVAIVGGHTEYNDTLTRPLLCLTAMGTGEFISTGGSNPGDVVVLTKGAGIEGTAILAADFGDEIAGSFDDELSAETICERAEQFLDEISVVPDARILREYATAMHDPTEGGVAAGLQELARASGVRLDVDRDSVPVRPETRVLSEAAGVDPLRIFGSGAVVATVPEEHVDDALADLDDANIEAAVIGRAHEGQPALVLDGETITGPVTDDLYPLWEARDSSEST